MLSLDELGRNDPSAIDAILGDIVTCTRQDGSGSLVYGRGAGPFALALKDADYTNVLLGLPFKRSHQDADGRWRYWCPALGRDGSCTNYENRPAVCRALVPGSLHQCLERA